MSVSNMISPVSPNIGESLCGSSRVPADTSTVEVNVCVPVQVGVSSASARDAS